MILTPPDISTRPSNTSALDTTPAVSDKEVKNAATEFGAVMNTLLAKHSGTDPKIQPDELTHDPLSASDALTEQALTDMLTLTPTWPQASETMVLTAIHLGPHLQVITPQTAAPEGQSLELFARSQGLDEAALQWLMGKSSTPSAINANPAGLTGVGTTATMQPGVLPTPAEASQEIAKVLMPTELTHPHTPWADVPSGTARDGSMAKVGMLLPPDSASVEITSLKLQNASDLMKTPAPGSLATTTASDWLQSNTLAAHLIKPQTSNKLDSMSTPLDLSALLPADMQGTLESMTMDGFASGQESSPQGQGHFSGRTEANLVQRTESSSNSLAMTEQDSAQRRENISTLAEKMGQAVGERILSELERGQWHLKLSLRPATLGHIEVEMRMRSGEMDAVFTAPQALTRELLNEGMSKLKDTLNQMGMDVASLKVDDGQSRQRGGESTPERQAQLKDNAPTESADAPVSQTVAAKTKMGTDGWDVMV